MFAPGRISAAIEGILQNRGQEKQCMKIKIYQVDAFTDELFMGNPAAVCPLPGGWIDDALMQNMALENNLSETAFYTQSKNNYNIRWFTPSAEVELCGHATLAAAHVIFNHEHFEGDSVTFDSKSGILPVTREREWLTMNFPTDSITKIELTDEIRNCFSLEPVEVIKGKTDYMLIFENEKQIQDIEYDLNKISRVKARGIIITARGNNCDFVSRFFAPQCGVAEDPVTGSAHTTLVPYWSNILKKNEMKAMQLSKRKGSLLCRYKNDRTEISGRAITYMTGEITI